MSFMSKLRAHGREQRKRRVLERAIADAATRSVRDELLLAAQRSGISPRL